MPLVLSLPGLLARAPVPRAPSLARLLALARAPVREDAGIAAALAPRYGVRRQTDWPLAPIRAAALGLAADDGYWIAANPVTLTAGRDDVRLDGAVRDLNEHDAGSLVATLNAHFAEDGVTFVAARPDAWFARTMQPVDLATQSVDAALGRTLRARLPEGRDARTWRRFQNEIQMLFFEHPVNVAREREGKPPANSVWFEFGGTMPARERSGARIRTWCDDETIGALARFVAAPAHPLPSSLEPVLAGAARDDTLVVAFGTPADVEALDRDLAGRAFDALVRGAVDEVAIVCDGAGAALEWRVERPSRWSRWTSRFGERNLAEFVGSQHAAADA